MDEGSELRDLRNQIRETELEIKKIQSQILVKKSEKFRAKQNRFRRSRYPEQRTDVIPRGQNEYDEISQSNAEHLRKLEYQISVKEAEREELQQRNQQIQEELEAIRHEILEKQNQVDEFKSNLFTAVEKKKKIRSKYELTQQKLSEQKVEIQSLKRLARDADSALVDVIERKNQPVEDRPDQKPQRDKLVELENAIRRLRKENTTLEDEIKLAEVEMSTPLHYTEEENEILFSLQDADSSSLQDDVLQMTQQLRVQERELRRLDKKISKVHRQSEMIEERYKMLLKLSEEPIPVSETPTEETVDELIARLKRVTQDMNDCTDTADQMLKEKIIQNGEMEQTIKRRLMELEHAKVLFARKTKQLKEKIQAERDKTFDREAELVDRIKELRRRLTKT